ncbi:hypothetical protein [Helicobacter sp. NHP22-001]|uniref:hypothetical protein n=1 Tax=Helicobacter sp. NHP22-001 TaxID=3040202 RepID=UPI00244D7F60|nr:hypothetical protein [Helicobacter sp. NHP22-001]GMB96856.1 LapA family protein [Helicobacter sp. NHP22-001]
MRLRYYGSFTLLFMIVVGWYVYNTDPQKLPVNVANHTLNLPIALWIVGVVLLFFIFTLLFILSGSIANLWQRYKQKRDFEKLTEQIVSQNTKEHFILEKYHNPHFATLSKILARFKLEADLNSQESGCEKVDQLFSLYARVSQAEDVKWRKYNLDPSNPFYIQNLQNKIHHDLKQAQQILKKEGYSPALKRQALIDLIQRGSFKEIPKALKGASELLDKSVLEVLLRAFWDKRVGMELAEIGNLCVQIGCNKQEYLQMAVDAKTFLSPDDWYKFFELLAAEDEQAEKAFLYVLLDLEMIEQARDRLSTHPQDEFLIIKAYLELKKSDKNYPLNIFFGLKSKI